MKNYTQHMGLFAAVVLLGMITSLAVSCVGPTMKGYAGPDLGPSQTALIRGGAYTNIESCDGTKLSSSQMNVTVQPGKHTVEIAFGRRVVSNRFLFSRVTASVAFDAEAGHTYLAYADLARSGGVLASQTWYASIVDQATYQRVAESDALPVSHEWIPFDYDWGTY